MVDGQQVECVENFTYLGSQLSYVDGSRTEQRCRMGIAVSMSRIWSVAHLTLTTGLGLYMSQYSYMPQRHGLPQAQT